MLIYIFEGCTSGSSEATTLSLRARDASASTVHAPVNVAKTNTDNRPPIHASHGPNLPDHDEPPRITCLYQLSEIISSFFQLQPGGAPFRTVSFSLPDALSSENTDADP